MGGVLTFDHTIILPILDEWRSSGEGEIGIQEVSLLYLSAHPDQTQRATSALKTRGSRTHSVLGVNILTQQFGSLTPKSQKMGVRSNRCGFQEYEAVEYLDNDKR